MESPCSTALWEEEKIVMTQLPVKLELKPTTSKFHENDHFIFDTAKVFASEQRLIFEAEHNGATFSCFILYYNCVSVGTTKDGLILTVTNAIENELNGYYDEDFLGQRMNFEPFILALNGKEAAIDMNCLISSSQDLKPLYQTLNQLMAETSDPDEIANDLDAAFLDDELFTKDNIDQFLSSRNLQE